MFNTVRQRHKATWLATSTVIACAGYGLVHHPTVVIESASAQAALVSSLPTTNVRTTCEQASYSLDELIECISDHMPDAGSEGFVLPGAGVQSDWRAVVEDLVALGSISECETIALPASLSNIYDIFAFHDAFDDRDYCVAMEVLDADSDQVVDRGWGTVIVNPTPERYLSIDIPHPIEDNDTNIEGIAIFKGVGAHTFVMSGSNRYANAQVSACQSDEVASDVAHAIENLFFPAVVEIDQHHENAGNEHTSIQFHGMSAGGCPNVEIYITHGSEDTPQSGDSIVTLKNALLAPQPSWSVVNPGQAGATCGKNGTDNVEGRYLNTGDETLVCGSDVDTYNERFIHIEQDPDNDLVEFRNPRIWIDALRNAFAPLNNPPPTTTMSFQDGVAPDPTYSGTADTWIDLGDPNDNFGADDACEADGDEKAVALRWDLSAIPNGSTVDEVTVTLDVFNATNSKGYYVYSLARDWTEDGATWNEYDSSLPWQMPGARGGADRDATPVAKWTPLAVGTHTFSINPSLVQSWLDDPATNHGVLIANDDNSNGVDLRCRETATASDRPRLTVVYH